MDKRTAKLAVIVGFALSLAACGLAGSEPYPNASPASTPTSTLEIEPLRLAPGHVEEAYPVTPLTATGAVGPLQWKLSDGVLPEGVVFSRQGVLSGEPAEKGLFPFEVSATDGTNLDFQSFLLAVDAFGVQVDGLHFGEAWGEAPVTLQAVGNVGSVGFEIVRNSSGGAFDQLDGEGGLAVYLPGPASEPHTDRIRATDLVAGVEVEVVLEVIPHPAPDLKAEFGLSDVWYVSCSSRCGAHGLPTDWDSMLRTIGLRSSAFVPSKADRLACLYVRCQLISELNLLFGRNADGTRGAGLAVSFPLERPQAPYESPAPGTFCAPAPNRFNVIGVVHGGSPAVLGYAFADSHLNELIENDMPSGEVGELGVFGNQIAATFNVTYLNTVLPNDPVGPSDEATLLDLIHDRPVEGVRARTIRLAAQGFARSTAVVLAHEIGHSLGLTHTNPSVPGSIMNYSMAIYPGANYRFTAGAIEQLGACLPGPGRCAGQPATATTHVPVMPEGGIDVCRLAPRPLRLVE